MSLVPVSKASKIDTTKTVSHQRISKLEIALKEQLKPLLTEIINSGLPSSSIFFNYGKQLNEILHTFVELFYRVGIVYVNRANDSMPRQTDLDNEQIKYLAEYSTNLILKKIIGYNERETLIDKTNFFVSIQNKIMESFTSPVIGEPVKTIPKSFNIEKQIDSTIRTIAFLTLNTSVIMKQRQLVNGNSNAEIIKYAAKRVELEAGTYVVWVTAQDEKVCFEYCRPLDGDTFSINDSNIPIPVVSTHPNCRCRLMTMNEKGEIFEDITGAFILLDELE